MSATSNASEGFSVARPSAWTRIMQVYRGVSTPRMRIYGTILLAIVLACAFGPYFTGYGINEIHWDYVDHPPSFSEGFPLGTDSNGRDLLTRILHGGRISLTVALAATLVSLMIGVMYGAISGYIGGITDEVMMRVVDMLYCLPFIFFVILLAVLFGRSVVVVFIAIGAVEWLDIARIVRGQVLSLKHKEFVDSARVLGVPAGKIVRRHILPNLAGIIIVYTTLTVPRIILLESALGYLGLGVQEPMASWGVLVADGARVMDTAPWILFFPAAALTLTVFCLNVLGDGLRDYFDPKTK
ncbi:MAG TPA: ABC transporter permease [Rhizobiaceae bacterium]|nr:ABC transporter permease [Rhizobiaceae bacterium]